MRRDDDFWGGLVKARSCFFSQLWLGPLPPNNRTHFSLSHSLSLMLHNSVPNGHVRNVVFGLGHVVVIESDTTFRIGQTELLRAAHPVRLWTADATRSGCLELFVDLSYVVRYFSTLFKVETLHIGDGLVNARNTTGITNGPFGAVTWSQVTAMDATDPHLADHELLCALAVPTCDVLFGRGEDLDHFGPDVALPVGE
jgi:hypothetical protein